MSFTDGKARIATEEDLQIRWGGADPGVRFRCYLCGRKFEVGDVWRFVYDNDERGKGCGNFLTCSGCDGVDVRERWWSARVELNERFWWALPRDSWERETLAMRDNAS